MITKAAQGENGTQEKRKNKNTFNNIAHQNKKEGKKRGGRPGGVASGTRVECGQKGPVKIHHSLGNVNQKKVLNL